MVRKHQLILLALALPVALVSCQEASPDNDEDDEDGDEDSLPLCDLIDERSPLYCHAGVDQGCGCLHLVAAKECPPEADISSTGQVHWNCQGAGVDGAPEPAR